MSIEAQAEPQSLNGQQRSSLGTSAARNLATTTKTPPQMQGITNRWVQRVLPWVEVKGGTYRVNRRLSYSVGDGRIEVEQTADRVSIIPAELGEFPALRGYDDADVLRALAGRFVRRELDSGTVLTQAGAPVEEIFVIVHGRLSRAGANPYGDDKRLGVVADGDYLGASAMANEQASWDVTVTALTPCTVMALSRADFRATVDQSGSLQDHLREFAATLGKARTKGGEAALQLAAGHGGDHEPVLPATFVNYEAAPREYELSVAQTVLRVHSRVADLFNEPMNQIEHQIKLTVQELREREEYELINNPDFGLLHNVDYTQRIQPAEGAPGPDDLDELLSRRRDSRYFLAHPRAIAAFGRECSRRGLYPASVPMGERMVPVWRGVPILPCPVLPISEHNTTSILVLRTGEDNQGVVGLHQTGIPDEYEPGLNVRFMGIDDKAVISYLVSAYFSAAVLVSDAIGMLENAEIGR
jgi:Type 2A encapsulin shell protein SrpI-like/Cyclic nucleotide-binding domain